jgi:hypothetical protein
MIAVAVVAKTLWSAKRLAERRAYFLTRAAVEADRACDFQMGYVCLREEYAVPGMYARLREHDSELARKYRLVASRPWLPVEPDPKPPNLNSKP